VILLVKIDTIFLIRGALMKKLLLVSTLVLSMMASPSRAIEFCKDVLEQGNPGGFSNSRKTWDEEWLIGGAEEVEVDVWVNDVPENLITAAIYLEFDAAQMSVLSADIYDELWDGAMSRSVANPQGPGSFAVIVGNFSTVAPDGDGDIPIARLQFDCVENCSVQITVKTPPDFDSVVGDSATIYDPSIVPNVFTIEQGTTTTTTADYVCLSESIYGENSEEVKLLRTFRSDVLDKTPKGRELIDLYYQWSPVIVNVIEVDGDFKQEVKDIIDLMLTMIAY
jgi:hypothetical protein